jgi:putative nucleotidyltransferase with HDIG domain
MTWPAVLPELERITDGDLRAATLAVLDLAVSEGGWHDPARVPYIEESASVTGQVPVRSAVTLVTHLRMVAAAAADMATRCNELVGAGVDVDTVLAGGLLHDVGLFALFGPGPDGPVRRSSGLVRHPAAGALLAARAGLPETVVHIILTHSVEGEHAVRTPESALVHWADWATYDVMRAALFPHVPQERAFYYYPAPAVAQREARRS